LDADPPAQGVKIARRITLAGGAPLSAGGHLSDDEADALAILVCVWHAAPCSGSTRPITLRKAAMYPGLQTEISNNAFLPQLLRRPGSSRFDGCLGK